MTRDELNNILDYRGIGPTSKNEIMELVWGQPFDGETILVTKSASLPNPTNKQADHETAEEKVAWLTEILVTKSWDPVFSDYWMRLARRNLRLGLPLTTPEPELNLATEQSSATLVDRIIKTLRTQPK